MTPSEYLDGLKDAPCCITQEIKSPGGKTVLRMAFDTQAALEAFFVQAMVDHPFKGFASKAVGSTLLIWKR